jgi:hypothetical protein
MSRHQLLVLFALERRLLAAVTRALPSSVETINVVEWDQLTFHVSRTTCAIFAIPWLPARNAIEQLRTLRTRCPLQPLVLVTTRDPDNLLHLRAISIDEVVWLHDMARSLWPAVCRSQVPGLMRLSVDTLLACRQLPACLRRGLVSACMAEPPIRSIQELARITGCHRHTLWYHWHKGVGYSTKLRLEDFLDWLILLRAADGKRGRCAWAHVATSIEVHEHTIARIARRHLGMTLRDLAEIELKTLAEVFRAQALQPVIDAARREPTRDSHQLDLSLYP